MQESNPARKHQQRFSLQKLEARYCLAAVGFNENLLSETEISNPLATVTADFDQDGDVDVFFSSRSLNGWYENHGEGRFDSPHRLTGHEAASTTAGSLYAGDLDRDNDLDVLFVPRHGRNLFVLDNTDGKGTFGDSKTIEVPGTTRLAMLGDIDVDGNLDIVMAQNVF